MDKKQVLENLNKAIESSQSTYLTIIRANQIFDQIKKDIELPAEVREVIIFYQESNSYYKKSIELRLKAFKKIKEMAIEKINKNEDINFLNFNSLGFGN